MDTTSSSTSSSVFKSAPYIAPDLIFQVTKNYLADSNPLKVNVGAGTYRDGNGQPWVLPSVKMAKELVRDCGHEYLPIAGLNVFRESVTELIFHDTAAFREDRVSQKSINLYPRYFLIPVQFRLRRASHSRVQVR